MSNFKRGDRVICTGEYDGNKSIINQTGIILDVGSSDDCFIRWDRNDLYSLEWWVESELLIKIEGERAMVNVGDIVYVNELECEGTVVGLHPKDESIIGVNIDEYFGGHDCEGLTEQGHGWWCIEGSYVPVNASPFARMSTKLDYKDFSKSVNGNVLKVSYKNKLYMKYSTMYNLVIEVNCKSDEDAVILNNILEYNRLMKGKRVVFENDRAVFVEYNEEEEKAFIDAHEILEKKTVVISDEKVTEESKEAKVYTSEEELLKELGIK